MPRVAATGLLVLLAIATVAPLVSSQYYRGQKKKEKLHDPCQHFVCTTGKDGRRTFCRVAHVCDKNDSDPPIFVCNFTLPVCVNRAGEDSYYDYGPEESVCAKGFPVIHLKSGNNKICNGSADCPMGYDCVDQEYGEPTNSDGVCCLAEKEMEKPPTCPKVKVKARKRSRGYFYSYKPIDVCMTKCYTNYDCGYGEICCNTGCGYKCIDIVTTTTSTTTTTTTTTTTAPTTTTSLTTTSTTAPTTTTAVFTPSNTPISSTTSPASTASTASTAGTTANLVEVLGRAGRVGRGRGRGRGKRKKKGKMTTTTAMTTAAPVTMRQRRVLAVDTNHRCPRDPSEVICGQFMCMSDDDCETGKVCCGSKTCNKNQDMGTACLKLRKKKKNPGIFKPPFLGKPSFGDFGYPSTSFGGSFGRSKKKGSGSGDPYFPTFPTLYQPYQEDSYGFDSGSNTHFEYDKSSPFKKPAFPSMYKKRDYDPPKFGFSYGKKKRGYTGDSSEEYDSSEEEEDMYEDDRTYFLKEK